MGREAALNSSLVLAHLALFFVSAVHSHPCVAGASWSESGQKPMYPLGPFAEAITLDVVARAGSQQEMNQAWLCLQRGAGRHGRSWQGQPLLVKGAGGQGR